MSIFVHCTMYTPVWSNSPTSTLSCKAIDRNGLTNPSDQDENVFRFPIPRPSMYIRYNHQEWEHKLFLACNWPWRAGFSSLTLCSSPLKNHWSVLPSKYSSLERCASVAQPQFPLSERWKIISRNRNVLNWFWLTLECKTALTSQC